MNQDDMLTILAALYALDNEQEPYQYRVKLARQILHSMTTTPGKPQRELPNKLRAIIDGSRISTQTEKKLYATMTIVGGIDFDDMEESATDCGLTDALAEAGLFYALEELYAAWSADGERSQIKIDYHGARDDD